MNIDKKRSKIHEIENSLDKGDFLIFHPPNEDILYEKDELLRILNNLNGLQIPEDLSTVQKSQWLKLRIIRLMGYNVPSGLRTKQAKMYKPKFINQLLDIFVQSRSNLQIWNYIPYDNNILPGEWNKSGIKFSDCRYLIIMHDKQGYINKFFIKKGSELGEWDKTGTKTIKWQANIPKHYRESYKVICGKDNIPLNGNIKLQDKIKLINKSDNDPENPLVKKNPVMDALFSINELGKLIKPLLNFKLDNPGSGQERIIGQSLEKIIAERLGYNHFDKTDSGSYPDLLNQLLEIKFQYSGTIDLGRELPTNPKKIKAEWNDLNFSNQNIRYCLFLMDLKEDKFITKSILIISGEEFPKYFNVCSGKSFKVQLPIPRNLLNSSKN